MEGLEQDDTKTYYKYTVDVIPMSCYKRVSFCSFLNADLCTGLPNFLALRYECRFFMHTFFILPLSHGTLLRVLVNLVGMYSASLRTLQVIRKQRLYDPHRSA